MRSRAGELRISSLRGTGIILLPSNPIEVVVVNSIDFRTGEVKEKRQRNEEMKGSISATNDIMLARSISEILELLCERNEVQ